MAIRRHRVLVIDDDPRIPEIIRSLLEATSRFEVQTGSRPALALDAARSFRPDLIILDVNMPGKDGGEVAREIAGDRSLASTPILFLTSLISKSETGGRTTVRGGMPFLAKPVTRESLLAAVNSLIPDAT